MVLDAAAAAATGLPDHPLLPLLDSACGPLHFHMLRLQLEKEEEEELELDELDEMSDSDY